MEQVSPEEAMMKSFKATIRYSDFKKVIEDTFWPEGIGCQRFKKVSDVKDFSVKCLGNNYKIEYEYADVIFVCFCFLSCSALNEL